MKKIWLLVSALNLLISLGGQSFCTFANGSESGQPPVVEDTTPLNPEQEELFRQVAGALRCPTCTGLSTMQSSEAFSVQIRNQVRRQVLDGKARDAIMGFFVERYGNWILREPPKAGVHLLAWLVPGLMLLFGPFLIWALVWKKRRTVSTMGIRKTEEILREMELHLNELREGDHTP